ncbi:MAG: Gfo/Idh/MocA family oxidoreductase [Verrucomicrobia bacterium]|nr:Gfo/Idh/MocA family oxidoreductase [Verrucomicrobiota bacterium]
MTAVAAVATPYVARGQVLGANSRIGIGVIGTGARASAHFSILEWLKEQGKRPVEVVAVCDTYRPRMQQAAERFKAKGFMDYRELLADKSVDLVCIATPDGHHCPQAIAAVRAGKDVYCEKPVSHWRQFALVKQLAAEVKKSGRAFQLGTQGMGDGVWRQMRQLVQDGIIGQPIHAECGYFRVGDWGERGMKIDDKNAKPGPDLDWKAFLGDAPKRPFDVSRYFRWRMYEDYAGGPVTDTYPHAFTPVASVLGLKFPREVVATGGKYRYSEREVPDTFDMLISYPEKITVAILGTQGNDFPGGTGGRGPGGRIPTIRGWDGALTIQISPTTKKPEIVFFPAQGSNKKPQTFEIEKRGDMADHWENLLDCCADRKQKPWSDVEMAYHVQTALIMGMLASRSGKTAKFDAKLQKIVV